MCVLSLSVLTLNSKVVTGNKRKRNMGDRGSRTFIEESDHWCDMTVSVSTQPNFLWFLRSFSLKRS